MRIQEVCSRLNTTKKAVTYYMEQGLIRPAVLDNGYRDFNPEDVERLRKIMILRKLGLGTADIKQALEEEEESVLRRILVENELRLARDAARQSILRRLSEGADWREADDSLQTLERQAGIIDRLLDVFPGGYGQFIALHFSSFLREAIVTDEQQAAYEEIVGFLDDAADLSYPAEWRERPAEDRLSLSPSAWSELSAEMLRAAQNPERFVNEHDEGIAAYLAFKRSEDYRQSPAFQLQQRLREFQRNIGYHERFIPAMKRLSPSYCEYARQLEQAADMLRGRYPGADQAGAPDSV
ncbi:MerR family transcriptional regulator [Cohnella cellulosilytica]|uniref:MerR family transcriptional regulator n=1 Tax=Cohnella cellulosilytica TaxID=986710 RepID=A0ABW2FHW4_9BACL